MSWGSPWGPRVGLTRLLINDSYGIYACIQGSKFLRVRTGPPEVVQEVFANLKIGNLAGVKHLTNSMQQMGGRSQSPRKE